MFKKLILTAVIITAFITAANAQSRTEAPKSCVVTEEQRDLKATYNALTDAEKIEIWKRHVARVSAEAPLTKPQRGLLKKLTSVALTPRFFALSPEERDAELAHLGRLFRDAFEGDVAKHLVGVLDPEDLVDVKQVKAPPVVEGAEFDCTCLSGYGGSCAWTYGWGCYTPGYYPNCPGLVSPCRQVINCGPFGLLNCNGSCYYCSGGESLTKVKP